MVRYHFVSCKGFLNKRRTLFPSHLFVFKIKRVEMIGAASYTVLGIILSVLARLLDKLREHRKPFVVYFSLGAYNSVLKTTN